MSDRYFCPKCGFASHLHGGENGGSMFNEICGGIEMSDELAVLAPDMAEAIIAYSDSPLNNNTHERDELSRLAAVLRSIT